MALNGQEMQTSAGIKLCYPECKLQEEQMQNQTLSMFHRMTGMSSESLQKQPQHSYYSKEQAELLAQAPGINMLTSLKENNMHLWGLFPHQRLEGRGCCLAVVVALSQMIPAPLVVSNAPAPKVTAARSDLRPNSLLSQKWLRCIHWLCCTDYPACVSQYFQAQCVAMPAKEQTLQPSPAQGTFTHQYCWQRGTGRTLSYVNNADTEKPGRLKNSNSDLIGVKQRSEKWQSSESLCRCSHPAQPSGCSPGTVC